MANNRMWLIHRPTKIGVMLGKRMGWGWYSPPSENQMTSFYETVMDQASTLDVFNQDDFILAMEDCDDSSCFSEWEYTVDKINEFRVFKLNDDTL